MNHTQILKRSWNILWSYRALWVIGFLLALATPSGGNGSNSGFQMGPGDIQRDGEGIFSMPPELRMRLDQFFDNFNTPAQFFEQALPFFIFIICLGVVLGVAFTILRYVSSTALVRMVDGYEQSGEKLGWRKGLGLGWTRAAWRVFLIDLLVYAPLAFVIAALFGCAAIPILTGVFAGRDPSVPGIITAVGIVFVLIFLTVIITVLLSLFMEIIHRRAVLGEQGVIDSIRNGFQDVTRNFKDVFLMWLATVGINIAFTVAAIPVVILLVLVGLLIGGGFGLGGYFLFNAVSDLSTAWIAAAVVGGLLFLFILILPMIFLTGLKEVYLSSIWTLTYRELHAPAPAGADNMQTLPAQAAPLSSELPPSED